MNGTMINYYFHCKRQCYMFAHRLNLEDNSEIVNRKYVTEVKKSDADVEASKWQLLYYLKILKDKGIERKGKLEFVEKNKTDKKIIFVELDEDTERKLEKYILEIQKLLEADELPKVINKASCKKCAYYEYCYI